MTGPIGAGRNSGSTPSARWARCAIASSWDASTTTERDGPMRARAAVRARRRGRLAPVNRRRLEAPPGASVGLNRERLLRGEGRTEQRGDLLPGPEQVGDEVHPLGQAGPVRRAGAGCAVGARIDRGEEGDQVA